MSLLNTKPRYFPTAIATESGWINPITKELLVSVGGLKSKLELEESLNSITTPMVVVSVSAVELVSTPDLVIVPADKTEEKIEITEEIIMNETTTETKSRKQYAPRKPKVIGEVTEVNLPVGKQLIGEVVEYNLDSPVIGE